MNPVLISRDQITKFIPHRKPMIMVDELIDHSDNYAKTFLTVREENIFCEDGLFREPGLIENIAQTVALKTGYERMKHTQSGSLQIGYLASVKELKIYNLPKCGDKIITTINVRHRVIDAIVIESKTELNNSVLAESLMNVVIKSK